MVKTAQAGTAETALVDAREERRVESMSVWMYLSGHGAPTIEA